MRKKIWPAFGHAEQIALLEADLAQDNVAQAYLFVGPDKIGKFTVAQAFARNLQCPQGGGDGCEVCQKIEHENHVDTFFWKDDGESLKVEAVREMINNLNLKFDSHYRIWLVQNASRLTLGASNALLKTLEEPIPRVVFIFTADHVSDLPATIVSRMRVINFHNLPFEVLKKDLQQHFPAQPTEKIEQAIRFALGKPGWALRLLDSAEVFAEEEARYQELRKIFNAREIYQRLNFASELVARLSEADEEEKYQQELNHLFENALNLLRTDLREALVSGGDSALAVARIEAFYRAYFDLNRNLNKKLVFEHLLLNF